ncbi:carbon-nitrogen hydrolase family protein [Pseudaestuariivita atlantica]|uniref:Nitrilase n=1 Tax=Pseudaestuariivita atlantica TaxID=1317121 RepID=A0A0L1JP38_9RHOB|nr:carbon-nitrogen hydrolase family protein [Pseudaestuariivita atlantica]KNG93524.1 nitrilase [Pseudaestuariivita atlantica]
MPRPLHIACLQTRPMPDFASAIDEAVPMAHAAANAGADILFLPEYCGGLRSEGRALHPPAATEDKHDVLHALQAFAEERQVWVNVGSIAVKAPGGKLVNRGYMIAPDGKITGRFDKLHLFDVDLGEGKTYRESDTITAGGSAVIHDVGLATIGHTICYDLRFPQLYRTLAKSGAEILAVPAAFTKTTGEAHWHVLNRARAIENTRFVVSACAIGPIPGGDESYGHSLVVSPWGEVLADGSTLPGVVHAQIDLDAVAEAEGRVPSLSHDRPFAINASALEKDVA